MNETGRSGTKHPDRDTHTDDIDLSAIAGGGLTQSYGAAARAELSTRTGGRVPRPTSSSSPTRTAGSGHPLPARPRRGAGDRPLVRARASACPTCPRSRGCHARLGDGEEAVTLEDLGSTNGTYLNGRRVHGRERLRSGDRFQVGAAHFKFLHEMDVEHAYYEAIYDLVTRDGLTDVHNRRKYEEEVEREFARARRHERPLSLILLDLDDFKEINDRCGHLCGDFVLKRLALVTGEILRPEQTFARLGGDEFAVLSPETDAGRAPGSWPSASAPGWRTSTTATPASRCRSPARVGVAALDRTMGKPERPLHGRRPGALPLQAGRVATGSPSAEPEAAPAALRPLIYPPDAEIAHFPSAQAPPASVLRELHVRNLAVLAKVSIDFEPGFNVLSGETGAGKSIVVDSLALLAGARASDDMIRTGAEQLTVAGVFEPVGADWRRGCSPRPASRPPTTATRPPSWWCGARSTATAATASTSTTSRRRSGRSPTSPRRCCASTASARSWAWWRPTSSAPGSTGAAGRRRASCSSGWPRPTTAWPEARRAAGRQSPATGASREERLDLLRFQAAEIDAARLAAGEDDELRQERGRAPQRRGDHPGAGHLGRDPVRRGRRRDRPARQERGPPRRHRGLAARGGRVARRGSRRRGSASRRWRARLRGRLDGIEADPRRLDAVEERLAAIERLGKKYGGSAVDGCSSGAARSARRSRRLEAEGGNREELEAEVAEALDAYRAEAPRAVGSGAPRGARPCRAGSTGDRRPGPGQGPPGGRPAPAPAGSEPAGARRRAGGLRPRGRRPGGLPVLAPTRARSPSRSGPDRLRRRAVPRLARPSSSPPWGRPRRAPP